MILIIISICYVALSASYLSPCNDNEFLRPDIFTIDGAASQIVKPSQATINFGIRVIKPSASEAISLAAILVEKSVRQIKSINQEIDIQTADFFLKRFLKDEYIDNIGRYLQDNQFQVISNFIVKTLNIEEVGVIIDTAIKAGTTIIYGINYEVSQDERTNIKQQLIERAIQNAKHKAEVILNAVQMKVQSVKTIQLTGDSNNNDNYSQSVNVGFIIIKNQ